jgi:hypothetical protein
MEKAENVYPALPHKVRFTKLGATKDPKVIDFTHVPFDAPAHMPGLKEFFGPHFDIEVIEEPGGSPKSGRKRT